MDGWDSISEKQRAGLCMRALLGLTFPPLQTANALNNNSNIPFDFESDAVYPTDWFPARRRSPSYCRWLFWNIGGSWRTRKVKQDSNQDLGLYSLFSSSFYCIHKTWNGLLLGLFMSTNDISQAAASLYLPFDMWHRMQSSSTVNVMFSAATGAKCGPYVYRAHVALLCFVV